jgi:hypothetical protein
MNNKQETKRTVTIGLEEYNEMRDFNNAMKANKSVITRGFSYSISVVSTDEAVKIVTEQNILLKTQIDGIIIKSLILDRVKEMNWFEFRKWKKDYNK